MTRRRSWISALCGIGVLVAACGGEDPVAVAAEGICAAIDAEPDDHRAFEEYELGVARERRDGLDEDELAAAVDDLCGRAVSAIQAASEQGVPEAATEEEPEVEAEPEPEPEPEPVGLRELDWTAQSWATTCAVDDNLDVVNAPADVKLTADADGELFGWFHAHHDSPVPRYEVDLDDMTFVDVTGDGEEDALFEGACLPGNVVQPLFVVWTLVDDEPVQLPEVRLGADRAAVVESFEFLDGVLRVVSSEPAPGSSPSEGYPIEVTTAWAFDGAAWSPQEVSRVDNRPPPEPPSASIPECASGDASAQDAALCLVAAANADDYDLAATVASPEAVAFVRETRGWGPIEWEFNGCSETCWFYEPSPDPAYHGVGIEMGIGTRDGGTIIEWIDAYG